MSQPSSPSAGQPPADPSVPEQQDTPVDADSSTSLLTEAELQGASTPAHRPSIRARVQMLWESRRILWILVVRDLKVRYSDTVLGYLWTLLDPLLLSLTYWFVFGVIVAGRGGEFEQPYLLWLLTGILPFQWTAHVLGDAGRLLGNDAKLVTASSMPREIWVLRSVTSRFIEFLFTLPITAVAMVLFAVFTDEGSCTTGCLSSVGPSWWLFAVPLAFAVQFVLNLGFGFTLAPACMLYPDIHRVVRVFATLYRYLSPVIYGLVLLEDVIDTRGWPQWIVDVYALNPMVGILNTYHAVIFPENATDVFLLLGISAVISIALLVFGVFLFRRLEPRVLKEL
jgi:ABC-2 type transport system permease protein